MSDSKKNRVIFVLFYLGKFSSLTWPWHKLMASHFYRASQGLECLLPIAPVGQYVEAHFWSRKIQLFHFLLHIFFPHPLPLLIRASCMQLHDMNWWPVSRMLHWSFHWPASTKLAEKPQGEARLATLLWDLQGIHGNCKKQQRGTEGKGIPWSCMGRRERLRVKQLWLLSLVSSAAHHNGAETLYDAVPLNISWKAALLIWRPERRAGNYLKDVNTPMHLGHHLLPP